MSDSQCFSIQDMNLATQKMSHSAKNMFNIASTRMTNCETVSDLKVLTVLQICIERVLERGRGGSGRSDDNEVSLKKRSTYILILLKYTEFTILKKILIDLLFTYTKYCVLFQYDKYFKNFYVYQTN